MQLWLFFFSHLQPTHEQRPHLGKTLQIYPGKSGNFHLLDLGFIYWNCFEAMLPRHVPLGHYHPRKFAHPVHREEIKNDGHSRCLLFKGMSQKSDRSRTFPKYLPHTHHIETPVRQQISLATLLNRRCLLSCPEMEGLARSKDSI